MTEDKYPPPQDFEGLRAMARKIFNEVGEDGITTAEQTIRRLAASKNWRAVALALEIGFGRIPNAPQEIADITLRVVHDPDWSTSEIETKELTDDGVVLEAEWEVVDEPTRAS